MKTQTQTVTHSTHSQASTMSTNPHDTNGAAADPTNLPQETSTMSPTTTIARSVRIPSEDDITGAVQVLEQVRVLLAATGTSLTAKERRHALRWPKGGEPIASLMVALTRQYNLQMPGIDPALIEQNVALIQRLQPLETKMRAIGNLLTGTLTTAKSVSWRGSTALYGALARSSQYHADLESELKPAMEFFKRGKSKAPGAPASPAPEPASTAPSAPPTGGATPTSVH